jgi:hypothetical protein
VALESCFYADQAFWKDQLALTYHLRTFKTPGVISASLLETKKLRSLSKGIAVDGAALFLPATPGLVSECRMAAQQNTHLQCYSHSNSLTARSYSEPSRLVPPAEERS